MAQPIDDTQPIMVVLRRDGIIPDELNKIRDGLERAAEELRKLKEEINEG